MRVTENRKNRRSRKASNRSRQIARVKIQTTKSKSTNSKLYHLATSFTPKKILLFFLVLVLILLVSNWKTVSSSLLSLNIETTISNPKIIRSTLDDVKLITESTLIVLTEGEGRELRINRAFVVVQNKEKAQQWVMHIPGELYMNSSFSNFAKYSAISNLHYLGELEKKGAGKEYAIWELGQLLGYKFNKYIWLDNNAVETMYGEINSYEDNFLILTKMIGTASPINLFLHNTDIVKIANGTDSNIPVHNIYSLMNSLRVVKNDPEEFFDFADPELQALLINEFGIEIPVITFSSVDERLSKIGIAVIDKEVESEQANIEIFNGSEISGLASRYSRKLSNNGMNVIRLKNTDDLYDISRIYTPDTERFNHTIEAIQQLLPVPVLVEGNRPPFLTTGDVILVLGSDLDIDSSWLEENTK